MDDRDGQPHDYIPPPAPPLFGRGSLSPGGNTKRMSEADLESAVARHQRAEETEHDHRPWWKRLFGR